MFKLALKSLALLALVSGLEAAKPSLAASTRQYEGQQIVEITGAHSNAQRDAVRDGVHELFKRNMRKDSMTARVSPHMVANLKAQGFDVTVAVEELASYLTASLGDTHPLMRRDVASQIDLDDPMAYWMQYNEINTQYAYFEKLADTPLAENVDESWLVYKQIGETTQNNPMMVFELGNPDAPEVIAMEGGLHAREWIGHMGAQYVLTAYIDKLKSGKFNAMFNEYKFVFMPLLNVDGYIYSYTDDRMWRKNRVINSNSSCPGVDLNRNSNGNKGWKLGDDQCSSTYGGAEPYSEKETQVMVAYWKSLKKKHRMLAFFDVHTYAQYIVYPHGYDFDLPPAPNVDKLKELGDVMADHISLAYGGNWTAFNAADWYPASGAVDDYWYDAISEGPWGGNKGLVYTVELRPYTEDPSGFVQPPDQILPGCMEWLEGFDAAVIWIMNEINQEKGVLRYYPEVATKPAEVPTMTAAVDTTDVAAMTSAA